MKEDYFSSIYTDFFPEKKEEETTEEKEVSIDELYITDESKELLKKIINYMKDYSEGKEKNYIPFKLTLTVSSNLADKINTILYNNAKKYNYIKDSNNTYSLYRIDSLDLQEGFIYLKDINGLTLKDTKEISKFFFSLEDFIKLNNESLIVISGSSEELDTFFLGREDLKNKHFEFNIVGISPDIQDVYNYILSKVDLSDENKPQLLDYLEATYKGDTNYLDYVNEIIEYTAFNKKIPEVKKTKTIDEIFAELNELVGLKDVKKVLYDLVDVMKLRDKTKDLVKISSPNLHMVFLGNPGTGKTTIARLISGILSNLGYIKEDKLVEVSIKDLVAEYVGQTAPKTMSVIEKAMNGVLFIDEAYALAVKGDNTYNAEAIATLIQAMENYRDKLVVIFAGYTKEMNDFLDSNSGITSRIGYTLQFADYTTDELIEIFKTFTKKSGFKVEEEALNYLREIIEENRNVKNFGNARFVRNIYEKTVIKHASRVKDMKQKEKLITITKADINTENLIIETNKIL